MLCSNILEQSASFACPWLGLLCQSDCMCWEWVVGLKIISPVNQSFSRLCLANAELLDSSFSLDPVCYTSISSLGHGMTKLANISMLTLCLIPTQIIIHQIDKSEGELHCYPQQTPIKPHSGFNSWYCPAFMWSHALPLVTRKTMRGSAVLFLLGECKFWTWLHRNTSGMSRGFNHGSGGRQGDAEER